MRSNLSKELWELTLKIRELMEEKGEFAFPESGVPRVLRNRDTSPHGAKGLFLLLAKAEIPFPESLPPFWERVVSCLKVEEKDPHIFTQRRLQETFEEKTYKLMVEKGFRVIRTCSTTCLKESQECLKHANAYDFLIIGSDEEGAQGEALLVEVKSDRNMHTGNIALELLRDFRPRSHGVDDERNHGSLIKTGATFWQVYYYDKRSGHIKAEVFSVPKLKERAHSALLKIVELFDEIK